MDNTSETKTYSVKVTLKGELMEKGSIEYKTLFDVIDGTASSVERLSKLSNYDRPITFYVSPPKEGSFEIVLHMKEFIGAAIPLIQMVPNIKDVAVNVIEYIKILKSLKGEKLTKEKIQTNENGGVIIKDNKGNVTYVDNSKKVNINLIMNASGDANLNKKISKIAEALEQSKIADQLILDDGENESVDLSKDDVVALKYQEVIEERPESVVGKIRQINNRTNKGIIVVDDGDSERAVNFEIDIKDISKLDSTVRNLAIAEGTGQRVLFVGERQIDSQGKLKKMIVNEVEMSEKPFDF